MALRDEIIYVYLYTHFFCLQSLYKPYITIIEYGAFFHEIKTNTNVVITNINVLILLVILY